MIKIAVANMKGGVGKSTTTMMLADTFSRHQEKQVLIVDCDPQSNVSQMFLSYGGLTKSEQAGRTISHWLESKVNNDQSHILADTIETNVSGLDDFRPTLSFRKQAKSGQVSLWPATPALRFSELKFDHKEFSDQNIGRPKDVLASLIDDELEQHSRTFDIVLFDCPPGFSTLAQSAIQLSDLVISPVNVDPVSIWSLRQFWDKGLGDFLGIGDDKLRLALLTMTARSSGGKEEKKLFREELRSFAGDAVLREEIPFSVQALRFGRRISKSSYETFQKKYGRISSSIERLGKEIPERFDSYKEEKNDIEGRKVY